MKEKDVPLAVPLQYSGIVYWEEPSLQRNVCISDFSSLAQPFHKTWAHWTDKALRLAYICQTQETLSTLRLFSAQKVHTHTYIYIIIYIYNIISLSKSGQDLYKRIMLSIFPGYIRHIPRVRSQRWAANLQPFDGHRDARGGQKPGDADRCSGWKRKVYTISQHTVDGCEILHQLIGGLSHYS